MQGPWATETANQGTRTLNARIWHSLWPYKPAVFSSTYSIILARTFKGSDGALSIEWIVAADSPEVLCPALRRAKVLLRHRPKALACSSSETHPALTSAAPISSIFARCRAFICAPATDVGVAALGFHDELFFMRDARLERNAVE
jgi:hypothetical protein